MSIHIVWAGPLEHARGRRAKRSVSSGWCGATCTTAILLLPLKVAATCCRGTGLLASQGWYTLLVPARVARLRSPLPGVLLRPQHELLLVPALDVTEPVDGKSPWWMSPLDGPALLCPPERVAALAAIGRDVLATEIETPKTGRCPPA